VETAQKTGRFEYEWRGFLQLLPHVKVAWERGQACFQEDLDRATTHQEEMEYFSQGDFAVDCYAYVNAIEIYPSDPLFQKWLMNGYMGAWEQHFPDEDEISP
jgi:hypothetical protein